MSRLAGRQSYRLIRWVNTWVREFLRWGREAEVYKRKFSEGRRVVLIMYLYDRMKDKYWTIILYDWRHWLVEKFDEELYWGGYFANPIWLNDDWKYEVRRPWANRCYVSSWAKEICNLSSSELADVYTSELRLLTKYDNLETERTQVRIDTMKELLK